MEGFSGAELSINSLGLNPVTFKSFYEIYKAVDPFETPFNNKPLYELNSFIWPLYLRLRHLGYNHGDLCG
jgi:hypothetical protein